MNEEESQYMDEAGIPMLVSRYIKIAVRPEKRDFVGYIDNHCVYRKSPEGIHIWDILLG